MRSSMRPSRDQWAMDMAVLTSKRATCLRRQVGAVLLNGQGHVLSTGYNGVAAGQLHCNEAHRVEAEDVYLHACSGAKSESGMDLDSCQAIHAEQNALLQCRDVYDVHTCYVTASPCVTCTKLLLNTSCQRIVFLEIYPHNNAQKIWESSGRQWVHLYTEDWDTSCQR